MVRDIKSLGGMVEKWN